MGRRSIIKKREKRRRQKKEKDRVGKSSFYAPVAATSNTLLQHASTIRHRETNIPSSPLLFSDLTSVLSSPLAHPIVNSPSSEIVDTFNGGHPVNTAYYVGDVDIDLMYMMHTVKMMASSHLICIYLNVIKN